MALEITVSEQGPPGPPGAVGPVGPAGPVGPQGVGLAVNATGTLAARSFYDGAADNFAYLASDTGFLYLKTPTGWSAGVAFRGPQGVQGPTGATGPLGPQGTQGPAGTGITVRGSLASPSDLPGSGAIGDAYLIAGNLWMWSGSAWTNSGPIQGPAGPQGSPGAAGTQGPQGAPGATGPQGPTGPQGTQGNTGPQGVTGATGPQGATGATGTTGATGAAGQGVPVGGAARQLLIKKSGTLYDTEWALPTVIAFSGEFANGNSGAAKTIDFVNGQKQKVTLNANTTLTISPPPGVGNYQLRLIQDATGGRTVTLSGVSGSRWLGTPTQPAFNTAANGETILSFYFDGTNFTQSAVNVGAA